MTKKNQKFVSVDASVLGFKKDVPVLESNRNHILATEMQLIMADLDTKEYEDYRDMIQDYKEVIVKEVEFLKTTLKLDDKQVEALYDLDQEETTALIVEVITKIMHIDMQAGEAEEETGTEDK